MKRFSTGIMLSVLTIVLFCLPSLVLAQGDPGADPDIVVPVDGGLSILAAAGVAYGVKKIKEYRKKNNKENMTEL